MSVVASVLHSVMVVVNQSSLKTFQWLKQENLHTSQNCALVVSFPPYLSMCVCHCFVAWHSYICAAVSTPVGEQLKHASTSLTHKQIYLTRQETASLRIHGKTNPKHGWPSLDMLAFAHMVGDVFNNNPKSTPTHSVPSRPATLNLQLVILPRRSLFGVYGFTLPCTVIPLQRIFN